MVGPPERKVKLGTTRLNDKFKYSLGSLCTKSFLPNARLALHLERHEFGIIKLGRIYYLFLVSLVSGIQISIGYFRFFEFFCWAYLS